MKTRTISQSMYDARIQELDDVKEAIYHANIDNLTCRMTRKKSIGEWTEQDQAEYDKANIRCKELIAIEEAKPLFNPDEKLVVVTDDEYAKLLEEIELKRKKEEEKKKKEEEKKLAILQKKQEEELKKELKNTTQKEQKDVIIK